MRAGLASGQDGPGGRSADQGAGIVLRDVSRRFGGRSVLDRVSLDVSAGEVLALLGPSGCGKSTLLRIIAGVDTQSAGSVAIGGTIVAGEGVFVPPERRSVGLIFQDYALFPHMTNLANVMFGLRDVPKAEAAGIAHTLLGRVGLAHYAHVYPGVLSGGEQQRVALARAMAPRPRVLLMDEPFSGLDSRLRDVVRDDTLAVVKETRTTGLLVTHDPEEAMRLADRIALMREGKIVQTGTPEQLYRAPADIAAARFFSELNEVPAQVRGGEAHSPFGRLPAPGLPDGPAVAAFRPQALGLAANGGGVPARVLARRFLGEAEAVDVSVEGVDGPLRLRLPPGRSLAAGATVGLHADPAGALVFPK